MSLDSSPEVLFAHAYMVGRDPARHRLMHPLAPLRPAEVAAWVHGAGGGSVDLWDSTFRLDPASFEVEVSRRRPRIIWLYCHPATRSAAMAMVAAGRRNGAVVLVGGPDAVLQPRSYLEGGAHAAIDDDGAEEATLSLVLALRAAQYRIDPALFARVCGLYHLDKAGALLFNEGPSRRSSDLALIQPLRDPVQTRIHLESWRAVRGSRVLAIRSGRGCPIPCGFCSQSVFGQPYVRREPLDVVREMVELSKRFEFDRFVFVDEIFLFDTVWLREFAAELKSQRLDIPFEAQAHPALVRREMVQTLAEVGLAHVDLAAGSGSAALLARLGWPHRSSDVYKAVPWLRDRGITFGLQMLVGLPGETAEDLSASLEMVKLVAPDAVEACRVDAGSRALLQKIWERVVAGELVAGPGCDLRPASSRASAARDAAVAWMRSQGEPSGDLVDRWIGRLRRPVWRGMVQMLPEPTRRNLSTLPVARLLRSPSSASGVLSAAAETLERAEQHG
ncbi:MAG TPA: hypothetical protein DIU15_09090 [Deltaproteobacteria bacterium]|nr:hypothetical protein [Deltaproteobacteria bacterium]HCP46184.1 hypothetical protein [Deltaproteobacteria bacterium]